MSHRLQILLAILGILLGVTCGIVVFVPDAEAQVRGAREVEFQAWKAKNPRPTGCSDYPNPDPAVNTNPCSDIVTGTKFSGGCTYYDWGEDAGTFNATDDSFLPITFPAGTIVTPAIFRGLARPQIPQDEDITIATINVDTVAAGGVITVVAGIRIGDPLPAGVPVPGPIPGQNATTNLKPVPYTGLTNRLVHCMRNLITQTLASRQVKAYVEPLANVTMALVTLAIALYVYDVLLDKKGARKLHTVFIRFALIVGVFSFTTEMGVRESTTFFLQGQESLAGLVSSSVRITTTTTATGTVTVTSMCGRSEKKYKTGGTVPDPNNPSATIDDEQPRVYGPWERIDCILASMLGLRLLKKEEDMKREDFGDLAADAFDVNSIGAGEGLAIMPAALFLGSLWTAWGVWILLLGGGILLGMIAAVLQAVIVFVVSMVVVTFLGIISPIVIPMVLFQPTKHGFTLWLQMMFAYMIQPAIILAYMTFMMLVIDTTIYGRAPLSETEQQEYDQLAQRVADDVTLTAQEQQRMKALTFPKEGSLMYFYNKVRDAELEDFIEKPIFKFKSNTQSANVAAGGDNQTATSGNEQGAISFWFFELYPGGLNARARFESELWNLVYALLTAALLFGLTYSFMGNIMNFGAILAGLEANSKMMMLNVYNAMVQRMNRQMQGDTTR